MSIKIDYKKIKFIPWKEKHVYTDFSFEEFNIYSKSPKINEKLIKKDSEEKLKSSEEKLKNSEEKLKNSEEKLKDSEEKLNTKLVKNTSKEKLNTKLVKNTSKEKLKDSKEKLKESEEKLKDSKIKLTSPINKNVLIQKINPFTISTNIENNIVTRNIIFNYLRDFDIFKKFILNGSIYFKGTETITSIFNSQNTNLILKNFDKDLKFSYKRQLGKKGMVGTPLVFECNNNELIIKRSENISVESEKFNNDTDLFICLNNKNINRKSCVNHEFSPLFIGSSEYVNETIIGFFLNNIFFPDLMSFENKNLDSLCLGKLLNEQNLGYSVFQMGYFQGIENNNLVGYNVMEKADNTLDKLFVDEFEMNKIRLINKSSNNENKIRHIILQIVEALEILTSEYDFFHGDLKAGNIFYKFDDDYLNYPVNGEYSNIRIKIADYGKSSLSFEDKRYFCRETKAQIVTDTYVAINDITLSMEKSIQTETIKINGKKYSIHSFEYKIDELFKIRHVGCPTFNSIDFYILIVSLCLQCPIFYDYCLDKEIIKYLFLDQIKSISATKKLASVVTANKILKGKRIICEVFDVIRLLI